MKDLLERLARNTEWAMKQRESMVFDVHNLSQCSQLQGAPPLLKASGKADAAWGWQGWGLQVRRVTVRCAGGGMCWCEGGLRGGICCGVGECM